MFGLFSGTQNQLEDAFRDAWAYDPKRSQSMEDFRERLQYAKAYGTPVFIENCTFDDSASVYERLFLDCNDEIRIVARGIRREIFNNVSLISAAVSYVKQENAKLILDLPSSNRDETLGSAFYNAILLHARKVDNIIVNFYKVNQKDDFIPEEPSVTFGDRHRMVRKKKYQIDGDYSKAEAEIYFNDEEKYNELSEKIDRALEDFQREQ